MKTARFQTTLAMCELALAAFLGACQDSTAPTAPIAFRGQAPTFSASSHLPGQPVGRGCSYGDAIALLESLVSAVEIRLQKGPDQPHVQTLLRCQYRLFWESGNPFLGTPVTFTKDDFFLGGTAFRLDYKAHGLSVQQAKAILDAVEVHVWWAEVTSAGVGELVELPLLMSPLKQSVIESFGLILWRQWGFISRLPPGEYMSVTKVKRPLFFEDEHNWTVRVFIL